MRTMRWIVAAAFVLGGSGWPARLLSAEDNNEIGVYCDDAAEPGPTTVGFLSLLLSGSAGVAGERDAQWNALVDEYLKKAYFPRNPSSATQAGLHQYDNSIEDYSQAAQIEEIQLLHLYEKRVEEFSPAGLDAVNAADRQILLGQIRSQLLTLEKIQPLEKNPDIYSGGVSGSIYVLMNRKFAPAEDRLRSAIAREK